MRFLGERRELTDEDRTLLQTWARTLGISADAPSMFHHRYLFQEGKRQYWLAVQAPVAEYFAAELPSGAMADVLVAWVGARVDSTGIQWMFIVNEFRALAADR